MYLRFCFSFVRGVLDVFAAVASVVFGVCLVVILSAAAGVVRLDAAAPFFEGELTQAAGADVDVTGATLRWNASLRRFALRFEGVTVSDTDGAPFLYAPAIDAGVDWGALSRGRTIVKGVSLKGLQLVLTKDGVGEFSVGASGAENSVGVNDVLASLQERAAGPGLEEIVLEGAAVYFRGPDSETRKLADGIDAFLQITPEAVVLSMEGRTAGDGRGRIGLDGVFEAIDRRYEVRAEVAGASAETLISALFGTPPGADGVVDAAIAVHSDTAGTPVGTFAASLTDLAVGAGSTLVSEARLGGSFHGGPMAVNLTEFSIRPPRGEAFGVTAQMIQIDSLYRIRVKGRDLDVTGYSPDAPLIRSIDGVVDWDAQADLLRVDRLEARIDGAAVSAAAEIDLARPSEPGLDVEAFIDGAISHRDLLAFWPKGVADGTRSWIEESVLDGRLRDTAFFLEAPSGLLKNGLVQSGGVNLSFGFEDAVIVATEDIPAIRGLTGRGQLTGTRLDITAPGGSIGEARIETLAVHAPTVDRKETLITITGRAKATAEAAVAIFDGGEFSFSDNLNFGPEGLSGAVEADFTLARPMLEGVTAEDVDLHALVLLQDIFAGQILGSAPLENGHFVLQLINDEAELQGGCSVLGVPISLKWAGPAAGDGPSRFRIATWIDPERLDAIGVGARAVFGGSASIILEGEGVGATFRRGRARLDLTAARLQFPQVGWSKPWGAPSTATFDLTLSDAGVAVDEVRLDSADARLRGAVAFGPNGALQSLHFSEVYARDLVDIETQVERTGPRRFEASISGRRLDAGFLLQSFEDALTADEGPITDMPLDGGPEDPFELLARLNVALVGLREGESWNGVIAHVETAGARLDRFSLSATDARGGAVVGRLADADRAPTLLIHAEDAGGALRGLLGVRSVSGGALDISVAMEERAYDGFVRIQDFRIADAPFIARLFAAGSLEGLFDLLNGEGIAIDRVDAPFRYADGRLVLRRVRGQGSAVGFNLRGDIDLKHGEVDLVGALTPFYSVNAAVRFVPLLGDLLTSRKGGGVVGVVFAIQGDSEDVDLIVNPLSLAAPGILRRLFELPYVAEAPDFPDELKLKMKSGWW